MSKRETTTIDTLFLELSQFTQATTAKELALQQTIRELRAAMEPFANAVLSSIGPIATSKLSLAHWHTLVKAYKKTGEVSYVEQDGGAQ